MRYHNYVIGINEDIKLRRGRPTPILTEHQQRRDSKRYLYISILTDFTSNTSEWLSYSKNKAIVE